MKRFMTVFASVMAVLVLTAAPAMAEIWATTQSGGVYRLDDSLVLQETIAQNGNGWQVEIGKTQPNGQANEIWATGGFDGSGTIRIYKADGTFSHNAGAGGFIWTIGIHKHANKMYVHGYNGNDYKIGRFDLDGNYEMDIVAPGDTGYSEDFTIAPNGNLFVSQTGGPFAGNMRVYSPAGAPLNSFDAGGSEPAGVVVGPDGRVYVTQKVGGNIRAYDQGGTFQFQLATNQGFNSALSELNLGLDGNFLSAQAGNFRISRMDFATGANMANSSGVFANTNFRGVVQLPIPEPATLALLGLGSLLMLRRRRAA